MSRCTCPWADQDHTGFAAAPASEEDLAALAKGFGVDLPEDYVTFLYFHDGAEITGDDITVKVFSADELHMDLPLFAALRKNAKAPKLVVIGSNADGELLVFDYRDPEHRVCMVPVSQFGYDDLMPVAASFDALIRRHGHLGPL